MDTKPKNQEEMDMEAFFHPVDLDGDDLTGYGDDLTGYELPPDDGLEDQLKYMSHIHDKFMEYITFVLQRIPPSISDDGINTLRSYLLIFNQHVSEKIDTQALSNSEKKMVDNYKLEDSLTERQIRHVDSTPVDMKPSIFSSINEGKHINETLLASDIASKLYELYKVTNDSLNGKDEWLRLYGFGMYCLYILNNIEIAKRTQSQRHPIKEPRFLPSENVQLKVGQSKKRHTKKPSLLPSENVQLKVGESKKHRAPRKKEGGSKTRRHRKTHRRRRRTNKNR